MELISFFLSGYFVLNSEDLDVLMNVPVPPLTKVNLTLLVVAEVTPGLPITCDVQVMVKVS